MAVMWTKLELLYTNKTLAHMLCMKKQPYSFKMVDLKFIVEQLIEFNKIIGKNPHQIDKTLDKCLYRGGNPYLTSRTYKLKVDSCLLSLML
jgi:hypothetical protein